MVSHCDPRAEVIICSLGPLRIRCLMASGRLSEDLEFGVSLNAKGGTMPRATIRKCFAPAHTQGWPPR